MRYREILEAPLSGYELHGDWSDQKTHDPQPAIHADKTSSAHHQRVKYGDNSFVSRHDRALIQKPETEAALRKVFARFNIPIYLFFLNAEAGRQIAVHYLDYGKLQIPDARVRRGSADRMWELLGPEITKRATEIRAAEPNACVIILTHNEGGPVRHPLTPWMIVHRIAHAYGAGGNIMETNSELMTIADAYGISLKPPTPTDDILWKRFQVTRSFCTFRAARENNILDNSPVELGAELFTQFIMQGRIKFQLADEVDGHMIDPMLRPQAEQALRKLEAFVNEYYGAAEGNMRGTIRVC